MHSLFSCRFFGVLSGTAVSPALEQRTVTMLLDAAGL